MWLRAWTWAGLALVAWAPPPPPPPFLDLDDGATPSPSSTFAPTFDRSFQRAILLDFYNSTGGENWHNNENWGAPDECTWHGVLCDPEAVVIGLIHDTNNLKGAVPPSLVTHPFKVLELKGNPELGGDLEALLALPSLEVVKIQQGAWSPAAIPDLSGHAKLFILDLYEIDMGGAALPVGWPDDCQLVSLKLQSLNLGGPLPAGIGGCTSLASMLASYNNFSGPIPASFANLTGLRLVRLAHVGGPGGLEGPVDVIATLPLLSSVYLEENRLTGQVPNFGQDIALMQLHENRFTSLADDFGLNLSSCLTLTLNGNLLTSLPSAWMNIAEGFPLDLENGVVHLGESSGYFPALTTIELHDNRLAMSAYDVFHSLVGMTNLMVVTLQNNFLHGSLDASFAHQYADRVGATSYNSRMAFRFLQRLQIRGNSLTGVLPYDTIFWPARCTGST